jgi:hypothetical protein
MQWLKKLKLRKSEETNMADQNIYKGVDLNNDKIRHMVFTNFHYCPVCEDGESVIMVNNKCQRCGFPYYHGFKDITDEEKEIFWKLNDEYKESE